MVKSKTKPERRVKQPVNPHKEQNGWRDSYYIRVYELALSGASLVAMSKALGVRKGLFAQWVKDKPALRDAINRARRPACKTNTDHTTPDHQGIGQRFLDYVYRRLPLHLQDIWEELENVTGGPMGDDKKKMPKDADTQIERLFTHHGGKRARQSIFIACLVAADFSVLEACRKCNVSIGTVKKWEEEPEWKELMGEVNLMRKEFADSAVWRLIRAGDPSTVKWANECINPDKGWVRPQRNKLGDGNTINITNNTIELQQLDQKLGELPLEERLKILRDMQTKALPPIEVKANAG